MTREQLARTLAAIEQARDTRIEVWRIVVDAQGRETGQRIYRGSFQRDSRIGESSQRRDL